MRYILQSTDDWRKGLYAYSDGLSCNMLSASTVFNSRSEAKEFRREHSWYHSFEIIEITDKDLFKAKLADT